MSGQRFARNLWLFAAAVALVAAVLHAFNGEWLEASESAVLAGVEVLLWQTTRQRDILRDLNRVLVRVHLTLTGDRS